MQKEYAKQLLSHANPYTKTEYPKETAIAIVKLCNENALYVGFRAPTPTYDQELISTIRGSNRTAVPKISAPFARSPACAGRSTHPATCRARSRYRAQGTGRYRASVLLRDGGRFPHGHEGISSGHARSEGGNHRHGRPHGHSGSSYPLLRSTSLMDIVDGHTYWQHPGAGSHNTPMVNEPAKSTVVELSRTAFAGKPYTVSEVNHPFPSSMMRRAFRLWPHTPR